MLSSKNLNDKTYEELVAEAIAQIPLYSEEWTNHNLSDPGITVLENFSAFAALQESTINEVPESVKWKLLKLAGFTPQEGQAAEILLGQKDGCRWEKPPVPGQKLYAQQLCFEFAGSRGMTNTRLTKLCASCGGEVSDCSELLGTYGAQKSIAVFGEHPSGGEQISFYFDGAPEDELWLYVEVEEEFARNPLSFTTPNPFAEAQWQVWTESGLQPVAVSDRTGNFLTSGIIRLDLGEAAGTPAVEPSSGCYMVSMQLASCDYDFAPRLKRVCGMLTRAIQKDTRAAVFFLRTKGPAFTFSHELLSQGLYEIYRRCGEHYQRLEEGEYQAKTIDEKTVEISPLFLTKEEEWMIAVYGEDMLGHKRLGRLIGYDDETFALPPQQRVYGKEFRLLAALGKKYYLFAPDDRREDALLYTVDEKQGKLIIRDAGAFEGAELFLGNYCLYAGDEGNVLPGTDFAQAYSCALLRKGRYREELEETRRRFVQDLNRPATAVTREDYERLIRAIPGLSIHKIRADVSAGENRVRIAIKPNSREDFPQLSETYCRMVREYLAGCRMLSTEIAILQPQYVPIHVKAVIRIRKYAPQAREKIEAAFQTALDGIHSDKSFGETIYIHEIFRDVAALDCVKEILELSLLPGNDGGTVGKSLDILLKSNALSYPGEINLELNTV